MTPARGSPRDAAARGSGGQGAPGALRDPLGAGMVLLVASRVLFWALIPRAGEDAYITFRYARNLVEGHGLVYNLGERVMGFTSPLWTLWCALGVALMRDPVPWSRATSLAADVVTLILVTRMLARHLSTASAWCFALAFAAWPYFGATAMTGMETSVMVALMAAGATLTERRSVWAGPCLGALGLIRPEGLAAALVLGLRAGWRERGIALAIIAAGAAALTAYYGNPVPQSLLAKASIYGTPGPWAGRSWWEWLVPVDLGRWPATQEGIQLFPMRVLIAPACAIALWTLRRSPAVWFAAAGLAVWAGYIALGVAYFSWYLLVPLVALTYLASAALPQMVRGRWAYITIGLLIASTWATQPRKIYVARANAERTLFEAPGMYLAGEAKPGQSVLLEPIGHIGWLNPRLRILDETGLVTPEIAQRRAAGAGWYADLIAEHRPEWLVVRFGVLSDMSAFAGIGAPFRNGAERDSVAERYEPAQVYSPSRTPQANDIVVARRMR